MSPKDLKPGEITERKYTVGQAADAWLAAGDAKRDADAIQKKTGAIVKAHLLKTGKKSFKGIRLKATGGGWVLDTDKVKEFLGKRLSEFQKRQAPGHTLERVP
jgi:hypothetical protein